MEATNMKEVYYDQYCPYCKYVDCEEDTDICHYCLAEPAREYSHKPVNFKEKNGKKGK